MKFTFNVESALNKTPIEVRDYKVNTEFTRGSWDLVNVSSNKQSSTTVTIGNACKDENGNKDGGKAGDSTGKEVKIQNWYSFPWTAVYRAKDSKQAEKIATAMEKACKNDKIGYNQSDRMSLYNQIKDKKFNPAKASTACATDCSALVRVCIKYAGIDVDNFVTKTQDNALTKTKKFTKYTSKSYLNVSSNLKRGDILLAAGHHTAVVLNNGELTEGENGTIPAKYGTFATREFSFSGLKSFSWAKGTKQRKIFNYWKNKDCPTVKTYFAGVDGCIFIACTTKFGKIGDKITWYFDDGSSLDTIMADSKNTSDSGANKWGHNSGKCILEFCGIKKSIPKGYNSPYKYFGYKHVDRYVNHGQARKW